MNERLQDDQLPARLTEYLSGYATYPRSQQPQVRTRTPFRVMMPLGVGVVAAGAIALAFILAHSGAPSTRPSVSPAVSSQPAICGSLQVALAAPGQAAVGTKNYFTETLQLTNLSAATCDLQRPSVMQVALASGISETVDLAAVPSRVALPADAAATLEFGSQIGCATFQPPIWATSVSLTIPGAGAFDLSGMQLNVTCGKALLLAFQVVQASPPGAPLS